MSKNIKDKSSYYLIKKISFSETKVKKTKFLDRN